MLHLMATYSSPASGSASAAASLGGVAMLGDADVHASLLRALRQKEEEREGGAARLHSLLETLECPASGDAFWSALGSFYSNTAPAAGSASTFTATPPLRLDFGEHPAILDTLAHLLLRARPDPPPSAAAAFRGEGAPLPPPPSVFADVLCIPAHVAIDLDAAASPRSPSFLASVAGIPPPYASTLRAYLMAGLRRLVGGGSSAGASSSAAAASGTLPAGLRGSNTRALAVHPRMLQEVLLIARSSGLEERGQQKQQQTRTQGDALAVLIYACAFLDLSGSRYARSISSALALLPARDDAHNSPILALPRLLLEAGAAKETFAALLEPLWGTISAALEAPGVAHGTMLYLIQALSSLAQVREARLQVAARVTPSLLALLADMIIDLPRSLWPQLHPVLDEWRSFVDPSPGSEEFKAVRSLPALFFDPVQDARQGERFYEYIHAMPAMREREVRQRREAAAAGAENGDASGGNKAMALGGGESTGAVASSSAGTAGGALEDDDSMRLVSGSSRAPVPASSSNGSSSAAAASPSGEASLSSPSSSAPTLPATDEARRQAVQRRDASLALLSFLGNTRHPTVLRAIAATPCMLSRLTSAAATTVGHRGAPVSALMVFRSIAEAPSLAQQVLPYLPALRAAVLGNPRVAPAEVLLEKTLVASGCRLLP